MNSGFHVPKVHEDGLLEERCLHFALNNRDETKTESFARIGICWLGGQVENQFLVRVKISKKMKQKIIAMLVTSMIATAWTVSAAITVLGPTEAALGNANVTTSQAKIGAGAWAGNGATKAEAYLYWNSVYDPGNLGPLKVGDINSLSFSTFKPTTGGSAPDWYLTKYTAPTGVGDDSWYGH
jgi:hypothetical protein